MMQQASNELGFEVDDIPLMIEAIPISSDCLILIVTKVEDPEELIHVFPDLPEIMTMTTPIMTMIWMMNTKMRTIPI